MKFRQHSKLWKKVISQGWVHSEGMENLGKWEGGLGTAAMFI